VGTVLALPASWRMHPTGWVGRLTAYHGTPPPEPVPIEIPGPTGTRTKEWEVACILDHKDTARGRKYLIDWVGTRVTIMR
jgi:Tfp pilus tip-associated adhesin PilY1